MLVDTSCPEDVRMDLRTVQHDLYSELVGWLFGSARRRYLETARLLNVETELSEALADMYTFDHRTLQEAHYLIGDYYSIAHDDGGQFFIWEDAVMYDLRLHKSWRRFFQREVRPAPAGRVHTRYPDGCRLCQPGTGCGGRGPVPSFSRRRLRERMKGHHG